VSRIILSRYDDGQECVVVGWDHPGGGCWWQEFNKENDEKGRPIWEYDDSWQEVKGYGGYGKGIPWTRFRSEVPEHIRPLVTDEVLRWHAVFSRVRLTSSMGRPRATSVLCKYKDSDAP
jgi:hypothetical protein